MKVTLKNGWEVLRLNGGLPLSKTFLAQTDDNKLILCTTKGDVQLIYEKGCSNTIIGSTAMIIDRLQEPLPQIIEVKANPLENELIKNK